MSETFSKMITVNLTPSLESRLKEYAAQRGWAVSSAVRYFVEDGLDGEARRAELASQAVLRPPDYNALAERFAPEN